MPLDFSAPPIVPPIVNTHPTIYLGTAASVTGTNFDLSGCTVTLTTDPSNNFDVVNKKYADEEVGKQSQRITDVLAEAGEYTTIKSVVELIGNKSTNSDTLIDMLFLQFFHKNSETASIIDNVIIFNKILLYTLATYDSIMGEWNITNDITIETGKVLIIPENAKINNTKILTNSGTIILNNNTFINVSGTFVNKSSGIINIDDGGTFINGSSGTVNNNIGGTINNNLGGTINNNLGGTINNDYSTITNNIGSIINNLGFINNNNESNFYNYATFDNTSDILNHITATFHNLGNGILTTEPTKFTNNGTFNLASSASIVGSIGGNQPIPV
jgi:hypothetical protein